MSLRSLLPHTLASVGGAVALVILSCLPAAAQLGTRPAESWIPTLESPERVASMKVSELIAALEIRPGMVVADVGAGSGLLTGPLARATGPSGVVYASDIDEGLLDHVTRKARTDGLDNVRTVLGTFTDAKLPDAVDLAFMNDVLHHVAEREPYVAQLARYLKPGGRLAIVEYTTAGTPHRTEPDLIVTETQVDEWARAAGLRLLRRVPLYDDRYFVIYRKS